MMKEIRITKAPTYLIINGKEKFRISVPRGWKDPFRKISSPHFNVTLQEDRIKYRYFHYWKHIFWDVDIEGYITNVVEYDQTI